MLAVLADNSQPSKPSHVPAQHGNLTRSAELVGMRIAAASLET